MPHADRRSLLRRIDPLFLGGLLSMLVFGGIAYTRWAATSAPPRLSEVPQGVLDEMTRLDLVQQTGSARSAPVRVVELFDFECPACAQAHARTWPILREHIERGTVSFAAYDMVLANHSRAIPAAVIAHCVSKQGSDRYWSFRDRLFRQQDRWLASLTPEEELLALAADNARDSADVQACWKAERSSTAERLREAAAFARARGVSYIPLYSVNGRVVGWSDLEAEIRAAAASGTRTR